MRQNFRPSSRNRKCRTALYAANSSWSKFENRAWVGVIFCEKNTSGRQARFSSCCRMPPTCESEASTASEIVAPGAGCDSGTAAIRAALAARTRRRRQQTNPRFLGCPGEGLSKDTGLLWFSAKIFVKNWSCRETAAAVWPWLAAEIPGWPGRGPAMAWCHFHRPCDPGISQKRRQSYTSLDWSPNHCLAIPGRTGRGAPRVVT